MPQELHKVKTLGTNETKHTKTTTTPPSVGPAVARFGEVQM